MAKKKSKRKKQELDPSALFKFLLILFTEIIVVLLLVFGFCFWWCRWRPSQIISTCAQQATDKAVSKNENEGGKEGGFKARDREQYYEWCLEENGLVK